MALHLIRARSGGSLAVPAAGIWSAALPVLIVALAAVLTRVQIFGNPIVHTDEGFYLLVGDRMIGGALPYVDIWDRKPFGLFLIYAGMRIVGGSGVLAYQLIATGVAFATAMLVRQLARTFADEFGATAAALAYLLWLVLGGAAGGQAELFFNLPVCAAALATLHARLAPGRAHLARDGSAAMLLIGVAMQIKYTAMFVGIFLGCVWLTTAWRAGKRRTIAAHALLWVLAALTPTLLAAAYYAYRGHLDAFLFANLVSIWGRGSADIETLSGRLGLIALVLAPLLACIRPAAAAQDGTAGAAYRFTLGWLGSAVAGLIAFGTYFPHYMLPVVLPASAAAAPFFRRVSRRASVALLAAAFVAGQARSGLARASNGSQAQLDAIVRHIDPGGCLFVYSGLSALYNQSGACIPTRYAFPSHLSRASEARAIGVDPLQEVDRIMRTAPATVIVRDPYGKDENWAARAIVVRHLERRYRLIFAGKLGSHPVNVYRLSAPRRAASSSRPA